MSSDKDLSFVCKAIRKKLGLSQLELSEILGVSRVQVGSCEVGLSNPSSINLFKMLCFYDEEFAKKIKADAIECEKDVMQKRKETIERMKKKIKNLESKL